MSTPVQNVPLNVIRVNLDGTTLPPYRKAWALAEQGGNAPVARSAGAYTAGETCVTVFNGTEEIAYFCDSNNTFTYWKTTFTPPNTWGLPDPVDGSTYEIYFVDVPGAANIAGLCAANP